MIAKLSGLLDSLGDDWAVVDIGGVGYLVHCSARTLAALPGRGEAVSFHVETHVREDRFELYGFLEAGERDWFKLLQTVQGVGAKMALGILAVLPPQALGLAIAAQDKAALQQASGVGAKLAGRLANDLKDKVGAMIGTDVSGFAAAEVQGGAMADAVSALIHLGYKQTQAAGAVATAARELGDQADVEGLIRGGLQELTR